MKNFSNKVAFVTGGSRGMGAAMVRDFANRGAKVAFTYVNGQASAEALAKELTSQGATVLAIKADSNVEGDITKALQQAFQEFGQLDILVNNAAIYIGKLIGEHTYEDFDRTSNVNVKAVFEASVFAANHMADGGRIINIGSCMADFVPGTHSALYAMSKSALIGLTKGVARDLGSRKITVNLVQPGPVNTDMNPDNTELADFLRSRMTIPTYGKPQDIANFVSYLASEAGGYITGAALTVDGGMNV
ncbi:3-oxoacyl-[acyl-carrier protein] reductase [Chitinophaga skermanii]|uniref:3-oxoacyl-[acyl-carrier protein] reductase n=1 Tax=Chitinophaga skermanii TaxID=331697 RepID=A0A327QPA0_9BACT|nr:SDR family oxidoreductase [Chitinophaga skermanii]RAJ05173.1 3-oxoacyl-[acyl-carrier protein] reductase [Chitinophaga skermanii]